MEEVKYGLDFCRTEASPVHKVDSTINLQDSQQKLIKSSRNLEPDSDKAIKTVSSSVRPPSYQTESQDTVKSSIQNEDQSLQASTETLNNPAAAGSSMP